MKSQFVQKTPSRPIRAVLLAAGLGTRLRPLTNAVPKCLIPIGGRPLLDYWFDRLAEVGVRDVLINTHCMVQQVRSYLDGVRATGRFRIIEAYEPELLGSAGTIHANRDFARTDEDCLIIYADNLSKIDLGEFMRVYRSYGDPLAIALFRSPTPERCGVAKLGNDGRIIEFQEKPEHPTSNLANAGIYAVSTEAYYEIADLTAFDLAHDVLPKFVGRMRGWVWDGYHRDIGTSESLAQARRDVDRAFRARASRTA